MDERRFMIQSLLRHLPPLPHLPEPTIRVLQQADECLALGQPELALETLALVLDQVAGSINQPHQSKRLGVDYALYFSDCLTCIFAHVPAAPSTPTRASQGLPPEANLSDFIANLKKQAQPQADSETPRHRPTVALITPSVSPKQHGQLLQAITDSVLSNYYDVLICITGERQCRTPPLRIWTPTHEDITPEPTIPPQQMADGPAAVRICKTPTRGDLLEGAAWTVQRLRSVSPQAAIYLGGLTSPLSAAIAFQRVAPTQIMMAGSDLNVARGVDAVATLNGPAPESWANRLVRRNIPLMDWSDLLDVSSESVTPKTDLNFQNATAGAPLGDIHAA